MSHIDTFGYEYESDSIKTWEAWVTVPPPTYLMMLHEKQA